MLNFSLFVCCLLCIDSVQIISEEQELNDAKRGSQEAASERNREEAWWLVSLATSTSSVGKCSGSAERL
jgi:hypothetical protein